MKKLLVILTLALALCLVCGAAMADGLPSVYAGLYDNIWDVEGKTINDVEPGVTVTVAAATDWPDTVWDQLDAYYDDAASHEKVKSFTLPGKDSNGKDRLVEVRVRIWHVHNSPESYKIDLADCTKGGTETWTCDVCGKVETNEVAPQDHVWELQKEVKKATCTEEGYKADVCKRCGVEKADSQTKIDKIAHVFTKCVLDQVMNCQTDYTKSTYHKVCKECGAKSEAAADNNIAIDKATFIAQAETLFGIKLPAGWDGHDFDKWIDQDPATCISKATRKHWCKICNATFVEEVADSKLKPVVLVIDQGNCADKVHDGKLVLVCQECLGENDGKAGVKADGTATTVHKIEVTAFTDINESITVDGTTYNWVDGYKFTADGTDYEIYHTFEPDWTVNPDRVVCKEAEYSHARCSRCGEEGYVMTGKVQDHNWSDWELVEDKDELGTDTSRWESYCQNEGCTELRVRALAEKPVDPCKEHEWGIKNPAAVKCGENKDVEFECVVCKATKTEDYTKEHAFTVEVSTTDATCAKAGVKVLKCANCDALKTEEIAATGKHTLEKVDGKAATCKEAGLKEAYKCTVCEKLFSDEEGKTEITAQEEIPADETAHVWEEEVLKAATCKEAGVALKTCSVCGKVEKVEIQKLAHTWDEGKITKEATKEAKGEKTYTCTACGETRTEEVEYVVTAAPKYSVTGLTYDGQTLKGKLAHDEDTLEAETLNVRVTFFMTGNYYMATIGEVAADGSFSVDGVGPIEYISVVATGSSSVNPDDVVAFGSGEITVK